MFEKIKSIFSGGEKEVKKGNISEWSYKRYCIFYSYVAPNDSEFEDRMNKIVNLVINDKETNIEEIAKKSDCTLKDCVFRLKYLKNKRWIPQEYFINSHTNEIKECSEHDVSLIEKYYEDIYLKHYSIEEMANLAWENDNSLNIEQLKQDIYQEIEYLYNIALLSGIKLDEETHEILYYTLEKKKKSTIFVTLCCPNCGALVDVLKYNSARCTYCNTIVEDTYSRKEENND